MKKSMKDVDSILKDIEKNGDIKDIREAIADLIVDRLKSVKNSLGYWEKLYFATAIINLNANINLLHQPRIFLLRICICNLEKAFIPATERDESYIRQDKQIDSLTYEQFMEELESIRNH